MTAGWPMTVIYETHCTVCDAVDRQRHYVPAHGTLPWPAYPEGWHSYDTGAICPRHTITISILDAEPAGASA